ncbi:excalibur calcium-binding domain-containing protein [Sphingopyxis panaciterrae]
MKRVRHYHQPTRYRAANRRRKRRGASGGAVLAGAAIVGALAAAGWNAASPEQQAAALTGVRELSVAAGLVRERAPQEGDYWRRCDDARAAGAAPIYFGEPGYRDGLDRDSDGIACEPYP